MVLGGRRWNRASCRHVSGHIVNAPGPVCHGHSVAPPYCEIRALVREFADEDTPIAAWLESGGSGTLARS